MTKLISEQIRSRPDFSYGTRPYYKKHTWRVALVQPHWRESDKNLLQEIWYRNRCIEEYLKHNETGSYKTRADRSYFVYLSKPESIQWIIDNYNSQIEYINGPVNTKHQDILLNDLTVVTRPRLWYKKFRYKIMSTRYGERDQEIFEEMQNFCIDSFEHGEYKLNDTFRNNVVAENFNYKIESKEFITKKMEFTAQSNGETAKTAFDSTLEKLSKQLRRYKRKIKNSKHNDNFLKSNVLDAQFQIINEPPSGVFINKENNSQEPLIFAELDTEIEELTVVDALENMKLGNASALMFRNSKHSGLNMIYKREDGLIGWVDPRGNRELTKV